MSLKRNLKAPTEAADIDATTAIAPVALLIRQRKVVDRLHADLKDVYYLRDKTRWIKHPQLHWALKWVNNSMTVYVHSAFERYSAPFKKHQTRMLKQGL